MGDGYVDKSATPLVYQPSAANDPQAVIESEDDFASKLHLAMATIGATIAPVVPLMAKRITPVLSDNYQIQRFVPISSNVALGVGLQRSFTVDLTTEAVTEVGTMPALLAALIDMIVVGSAVYVLGTTAGKIRINKSTDGGASWAEVCSYTAPGTIGGDGQISANATGTTVIAAFSVTLNNNFFSLVSTDSGASFGLVAGTAADVMSRNNSVAWVSGNTWLATSGSSSTSKLYCWKSEDNAATWTLKQTITSASLDTYCKLVAWSALVATTKGYRTADAGETWAAEATATAKAQIKMGDLAGFLFAAGAFYFTTDGGDTVTKFQPSGALTYALTVYSTCASFGSTIVFPAFTTNEGAHLFVLKLDQERFVTLPEFQVTSPAKLSALLTATAQLVTASKQGTVKLYLQHKNDIVTSYSSLADVAGAWTDCGTLTHDTPLSLPSFTARAGEVIYPRLGFTCTDTTGVQPAPELSSIAFTWASDVDAPGNPTVTRIFNTSGDSTYGYRVDFGDLPATARHLIVEGRKNAGPYVPFNVKGQWGSGDYMKLRGNRDVIEEAGERNEKSLSSNTGFIENDTAQVKVAAEDDLGNRSAFVESEVITMSSAVPIDFVPVLTRSVTAQIRKRLKATIRS